MPSIVVLKKIYFLVELATKNTKINNEYMQNILILI
jgi:hypothetical protein